MAYRWADEDHASRLRGQRGAVTCVPLDLAKAGVKEPVAQLREAEQPGEERQAPHPPVANDRPLSVRAAAHRVELALVDEEPAVPLGDGGGNPVRQEPVLVDQLHQEPAARGQGAVHLRQHGTVLGVVEVAVGGEPAHDYVKAAAPGNGAHVPWT
jgi:hypothetical protein